MRLKLDFKNRHVQKPPDNFYLGLDCNSLGLEEARSLVERGTGPLQHRGEFHLTVIDPKELRKLHDGLGKVSQNSYWIPTEDLVVLGIGEAQDAERCRRAFYLVVEWPSGQKFRAKFGLGPKDFHITLGFVNGDVHGVSKGPETIICDPYMCSHCNLWMERDFDVVVNHLECHLDSLYRALRCPKR